LAVRHLFSYLASGDVTLRASAPTRRSSDRGSGTTYDVAVVVSADGTVVATIGAGAAHDAAGNASTASTSSDNTITYDATAPTVRPNQDASQAHPTNNSPVHLSVVFSEPVAD